MKKEDKKYSLFGLFLVIYFSLVYLNVWIREMSIDWAMVVFGFTIVLPIVLIAIVVDVTTDSERARKLRTLGLSLIYIAPMSFWIFSVQYGEDLGESMLLGVWLAFPLIVLWLLYREVR